MESSRVAAVPLFADLPAAELAAVASVAFEVELASGQALATEGDLGYALFAIESGTADIAIEGATVRTIGSGDVVGEMAVLASPPDAFDPPELTAGGHRTASVIATSPMRLIGWFKRDVWALDQRAPIAIGRLREILEERRSENTQRAMANQPDREEQGGLPDSGPRTGTA